MLISKYKADMDALDDGRENLLNNAVANGFVTMAETLVYEFGCNLSKVLKDGSTIIPHASRNQQWEMIE